MPCPDLGLKRNDLNFRPSADRLNEVLAVLYLAFNEGHLASGGGAAERRNLAEDALWLTNLLVRLMPDEPEPVGLLVLMRLQLARAATRFDATGRLVLLQDQDRSRWDHRAIAESEGSCSACAPEMPVAY